jgi:anti-sigma B factor antagonist
MDELSATGQSRLSFEISRGEEGSVLLRLGGELDIATTDELEAALGPLIDDGTRRIVVDASSLEFADSSAIALLVRLANALEEVEIRQPPQLLAEVITRMGLAERLRLVS